MNQASLYDEGSGPERRDEGIAAVNIKGMHWKHRATQALLALPIGTTFCSESLREIMGDDNPHHPNAWGAVIRAFQQAGNAEVTGFKQATRPEAHARIIRTYRRIEKTTDNPCAEQ